MKMNRAALADRAAWEKVHVTLPQKLLGEGLADRIEQMFVEELAGPGAVRATLRKYLA